MEKGNGLGDAKLEESGGRYNRWKGGSSSSEKDPALKATIEKKRKRRIGQKIEVSGQDTRLLSAVRCAKLSN